MIDCAVLSMADTLLTADRRDNGDDAEHRYTWHVLAVDRMSGKTHQCQWTDAQMGAVSALFHGIGENCLLPSVGEYLYSVAEPAVAGFPMECRPIP